MRKLKKLLLSFFIFFGVQAQPLDSISPWSYEKLKSFHNIREGKDIVKTAKQYVIDKDFIYTSNKQTVHRTKIWYDDYVRFYENSSLQEWIWSLSDFTISRKPLPLLKKV